MEREAGGAAAWEHASVHNVETLVLRDAPEADKMFLGPLGPCII